MNERGGMSVADAEAYTDAVAQVSSGNWQQILWAHQQGIPGVLGMTTEEWVKERIGGYIRLSIADRRGVVQGLADEGLSQREIASVVGAGVATVNRDLSVPNGTENNEIASHDDDFRSGGVPSGTNQSDAPLLSVVDLETGEIIEPRPVPLNMDEVAYQLADDAGKAELDRLNYLHALSRSMQQVLRILEYDPERVAEVIDPEFKDRHIDAMVKCVTDWATRVERAMPTGLHIIKGGR